MTAKTLADQMRAAEIDVLHAAIGVSAAYSAGRNRYNVNLSESLRGLTRALDVWFVQLSAANAPGPVKPGTSPPEDDYEEFTGG